MLNKAIKFYYDFFDKKIKHSTVVVFLIIFIIFGVGFIFSNNQTYLYSKNSILDYNQISNQDIIIIGGTKYRVQIEKIED